MDIETAAIAAWKSEAEANRWLDKPHGVLNGQTPREYAKKSQIKHDFVMHMLATISNGSAA